MASDYVDQVATAIIKQLKEGTAPWQKPWQPGERFMPYNPTTGNEYRGMNAVWLMTQSQARGFTDARWMTYRQSQEQDAQVRKGEKGTPIQFWKWQGLEPVKDASGKPLLDQDGQPVRQMVRYERPRVMGAVVFNAEQIDGLPPALARPVRPEWERHAQAETILANSGVPVRHIAGDRAFYRLAEDTITLPERSQFPSGDRYYATALHELGHATGHPSRLARDLAHPFGSGGYAREELRAEIGSLMLGEQLGIGHDPSQHVAYVASWIKALEQDPREVFRAATDAEKIVKLIRSYELDQEQAIDQGHSEEAALSRLTPRGVLIPWQKPELAPPSGQPQPASHYADMIATSTGHLPSTIQREAVTRMVDFAAPDIVLPGEPESMKAYHRSVAVGGVGHITPDTVADLYSKRSIRQDDAERFMGAAVTLADWARGRAVVAGLSQDDADHAATLADIMQSVPWGAGHPDVEDGLQPDERGRRAASAAAIEFASKGPVQASLASLIADMEIPPSADGSFAMGQLYVPERARAVGLTAAGLDRDNPGADLIAPEQEQQPRQPATVPIIAGQEPTMIRPSSPALQAPSPERTYLAVPYAEKDDAKQLGAKWDRAEKAWYVPAGMELEAFTPWMPAKGSVHIAVDANPVEQFAEALRESGLQLDGAPQMDGQLHRVRVEGDKGTKRSGAYHGHLDGRPAGFIQNHRTGVKQNWKASGQAAALDARDRAQMAADAAQKRHDRAREREQQAERVAQQVDAIWTAATPVEAHPYLADKGVQSHGLRQDEAGRLLVPVQDADGRLWSVQKIGADGFKQFQEGGRVEGGHFVIGDVRQPDPVLIAEGYATAATLHEMTEMPVIVAFNAGNLLAVAQTYRALDPARVIYIAGDDDRQRAAELDAQGRPKVNVGRVKAEEAAAAIGGQAVFPEFAAGINGTDWNDLAQGQGRTYAADALRSSIAIADREQTVLLFGAARDGYGGSPLQEIDQAAHRAGKTTNQERTLVQAPDQSHER